MPDNEPTPIARLFVAALLPPSVTDALKGLSRPPSKGVRWTEPEGWHVTLRFLGTVPVASAIAALGTVESASVVAHLGPAVRPLGSRLAVVPVEGVGGLAEKVDAATADVAEKPAEYSFSGHITLARSRSRFPKRLLGAEIEAAFDVEEIHLIRSHLGPTGPRYEVISSRRLGEVTS